MPFIASYCCGLGAQAFTLSRTVLGQHCFNDAVSAMDNGDERLATKNVMSGLKLVRQLPERFVGCISKLLRPHHAVANVSLIIKQTKLTVTSRSDHCDQ